MKKKLPRIGLGKWVLIAAFIAGFNLLAASAHAIPTTLDSIVPAVADGGTGTVLAWFTGTTSLPTPLGINNAILGKKEDPGDKDTDNDKDKDGKDQDGDEDNHIATVPDGGNTLLLLGAAFLGVAIAGRRFKGITPDTQ